MIICILGRQPEIGLAELEALYGADRVTPVGADCALVDSSINFERLGGSVKAATLVSTLPGENLRGAFTKIAKLLPQLAKNMPEGKAKLGLSLYGFDMRPYDLNGEALRLKKVLKQQGRSCRVVPNESAALSSAQTFHNQLAGELGLEFVIVRGADNTYIGHVTDVQNIDSYRARDRERPKRDAFVGMLPPKLAQTIINLATGKLLAANDDETVVLDPFCGTGVIPQEALLMGYKAYGTDNSAKMVDYTRANIEWLSTRFAIPDTKFEEADATDHIWLQPISVVACEGYLGQPLGGIAPTKEKLATIVHDCNSIMRDFLKNIAPQLADGTRLCVAMPAWVVNDQLHRLPLIDEISSLGFNPISFTHAPEGLIYRRPEQTTARELVVIEKTSLASA